MVLNLIQRMLKTPPLAYGPHVILYLLHNCSNTSSDFLSVLLLVYVFFSSQVYQVWHTSFLFLLIWFRFLFYGIDPACFLLFPRGFFCRNPKFDGCCCVNCSSFTDKCASSRTFLNQFLRNRTSRSPITTFLYRIYVISLVVDLQFCFL